MKNQQVVNYEMNPEEISSTFLEGDFYLGIMQYWFTVSWPQFAEYEHFLISTISR